VILVLFLLLPLLSLYITDMITLMERGSGVADVYVLCLEEFTSVGILPPDDSSMFRIFLLAK
jgi:hypothetical protein